MRDERDSDEEMRDERRKNDVVTGTRRGCRCAQPLLSSLISRSRYLSSLVAVLKPVSLFVQPSFILLSSE